MGCVEAYLQSNTMKHDKTCFSFEFALPFDFYCCRQMTFELRAYLSLLAQMLKWSCRLAWVGRQKNCWSENKYYRV